MNIKFKLLILALVLTAGFYFRTDILRLYSDTSQKIIEIEQTSAPGFDKFKEDIAAVVNSGNQVIAPPPLKVVQEVPSSFLTLKGTITETNNQRVENGLAPLKENAKLDEAAKAKAQDMFDKQYFEHVSPTGRGPADLAKTVGYDYLIIGENLALGNFENDKKLVEAWMASPGHRANILNVKYTEIGVAVEKGIYEGRSVWMAVQEFGRPASACPKVDAALKAQIDNYNIRIEAMSGTVEAEKAALENMDVNRENISEYNTRVNAYNDLVRQYNALIAQAKIAVAEYNGEVQAYNACLK